jgi:hypothetical protein
MMPVDPGIIIHQISRMSTLDEIERAAEALPASEKQELMLFLAKCLRVEGGPLPEPRDLTPEEMKSWIQEDEADLRRFRRGK